MKKKVIIVSLVLLFFVLVVGSVLLIKKFNDKEENVLGVWWWNDELGNEYLEFASENNISEIYYCSSKFNEETNEFIRKANSKGMKVFWLAGEYEWIENYSNLEKAIEEYLIYQNNYKYVFEGIHLDIEPHQHPEFESKRNELITKFVGLTYYLKDNYSSLYIEYDLPFWLDDVVTYDGVSKEAFKHVMDTSSRVTLMSYRDSAEKIYDVSKEEIEYAKEIGKNLNLGVETESEEGDNVSFMEEGKEYMHEQLRLLKEKIPKGYGIVIHHIYTYYHLKNN